jgi:hypothetical protein
MDRQSGILQLVHDYSPAEFRNNVIGLAKLGKVFKLPTVLTTSLGQSPNGPFIPEVVMCIPSCERIRLSSWLGERADDSGRAFGMPIQGLHQFVPTSSFDK